MRNYKGYYIDHIIFNTTADIDAFIREKAVEAYQKAVELFAMHPDMEHSVFCDEKAEKLVKQFGFTWSEVENLEIATLEAI